MKRKAGSSQERRARSADHNPSTRQPLMLSPLKERAGEVTSGTEMPLDAEDFVLASLEARVRAEEARVVLGSGKPLATLTIRLRRSLLLRLGAEAAQRNVTPSKLIELALAQYLPRGRAGRGRR